MLSKPPELGFFSLLSHCLLRWWFPERYLKRVIYFFRGRCYVRAFKMEYY